MTRLAQLKKNQLPVALNGTTENPYARWGLRCNPFPQIARYEVQASVMRLQELGGEPIPNCEFIRAHLRGYFSDEFIDLCCSKFEPGKLVKFVVTFPEKQ